MIKQQLKLNNDDWINIDLTIVPISFQNHSNCGRKGLYFYQRKLFYQFEENIQTYGKRRAGFTHLLETVAVQAGLRVRSSIRESIWIPPEN